VALTTPHIMGTAETRKRLPAILDEFRRRGAGAEPVYIGSYRNADALLIPAALAAKIAPLLEDVMIAERAKARLAEPVETVSRDELVVRLGLDEAAISAETAALLAELDAPTT
jgi:hypothetical protein